MISRFLGVSRTNTERSYTKLSSDTIASVMKAIIDDGTFPSDYGIIHNKEGVDLLPANIELSGMEQILVNTMSREYVLKEYLSQVKDRYDYVLIDCMPSLGMLTINALVAADSVLIPCQPNYLCVIMGLIL